MALGIYIVMVIVGTRCYATPTGQQIFGNVHRFPEGGVEEDSVWGPVSRIEDQNGDTFSGGAGTTSDQDGAGSSMDQKPEPMGDITEFDINNISEQVWAQHNRRRRSSPRRYENRWKVGNGGPVIIRPTYRPRPTHRPPYQRV